MKATLQLVAWTWSLVIVNLGVAVQGDWVGAQVGAHLVSGTIHCEKIKIVGCGSSICVFAV